MVEMTRDGAEQLIGELIVVDGEPFRVDSSATQERPWGWVIFYQTEEYLKTRSPDEILFGNAPYLVTRKGEVFVTGSHAPVEEFVKALDVELDESSSGLGKVMQRIRSLFKGAMPARVPDETILAALPKGSQARELFKQVR